MTSPTSILAKLEELRKWQEKQQERLLKQHQQRLEQNEQNFSFASDYESVNDRSIFNDSAQKTKNDDDNVVSPAKKPNDLLVEKLQNDENPSPENKPKQPFLRKGTGLIRYKLNPGEQYKPFRNTNQSKVSINRKSDTTKLKTVGTRNQISRVTEKPNKPKEKTLIVPLKVPQVGIKAKWCRVTSSNNNCKEKVDNIENKNLQEKEKHVVPLKPALFPTNAEKNDLKIKKHKPNIFTSNPNVIAQINEFAAKHFATNFNDNKQEAALINQSEDSDSINGCVTPTPGELTLYENALAQELMVFEALEERAMQSSFCSTNSSVVRLLASTPNKQKCNDNNQKTTDQFVIQDSVPAIDVNRQKELPHQYAQSTQTNKEVNDKCSVQSLRIDLHNNTHKEESCTSASSVTSDDIQSYQRELLQVKHFQDTEKWSDVSDNFSVSSSDPSNIE